MTINGANLGTVMAEGAMKASVEILRAQNRDLASVDVDALVLALKREVKAALTTVLDDGKVLMDAGRSGWLDALVKAEIVGAAQRAVATVAS